MAKCTCSIFSGIPFSELAPKPSDTEMEALDWPMKCFECGGLIQPKEVDTIVKFDKYGIQVLCKPCGEIMSCFFCTATPGKMWQALEKNLNEIPLGSLTELLSLEARDKLIEKVDIWWNRR